MFLGEMKPGFLYQLSSCPLLIMTSLIDLIGKSCSLVLSCCCALAFRSHPGRCGCGILVDATDLSWSIPHAFSVVPVKRDKEIQGRETGGTLQQALSIILTYKGVDGSVNTMPYPGCINYNSCKQDGEINCDLWITVLLLVGEGVNSSVILWVTKSFLN